MPTGRNLGDVKVDVATAELQAMHSKVEQIRSVVPARGQAQGWMGRSAQQRASVDEAAEQVRQGLMMLERIGALGAIADQEDPGLVEDTRKTTAKALGLLADAMSQAPGYSHREVLAVREQRDRLGGAT